MVPKLHELLRYIVIPLDQENRIRYHVLPVEGYEGNFFGRSSAGHACLLLSTSLDLVRTPLRLATIEVNYAVPCNIALVDGTEQVKTLTVISCTDTDRAIQRYFAHVCETLLRIVGKSPSLRSVVEVVTNLVELFQKLTKPPRKSAIRLLAELFVISVANDPKVAVRAWRSDAYDRFDFSMDDVRLEVKASGNRDRAHNFSLEQCTPPYGTCGLLVSLFVESSGGGMSLLDLIQQIEHQIRGNTDLIMKLQETVTEGLGNYASTALVLLFDAEVANSSLRVYQLERVPKVPEPLPSSVSQVRFRSDLSNVPTAEVSSLRANNEIVATILPRWT